MEGWTWIILFLFDLVAYDNIVPSVSKIYVEAAALFRVKADEETKA